VGVAELEVKLHTRTVTVLVDKTKAQGMKDAPGFATGVAVTTRCPDRGDARGSGNSKTGDSMVDKLFAGIANAFSMLKTPVPPAVSAKAVYT
jgi:hypothetical protein